MDPVDLFVMYLLLSSVLAWVPIVVGPGALALKLWKWRRATAVADHEALELLAGRALPGAGNGSWSALASVSEPRQLPVARNTGSCA